MSSEWQMSSQLSNDASRWQRWALIAGSLLLLVCMGTGFFYADQFFRSYLFAYLFVLGVTLGSMALLMTQYLTGGAWGVMTRRVFESASRTLPVVAILFIPILIGIPHLYPWSHADVVIKEEVVRHRHAYMNTPMFIIRAVIYFAIWGLLVYLLNSWSAQEDDQSPQQHRFERLSAPGLILYVFTVTFASVDWAESLLNDWYSTMWGFLFVAGQGLTAMCFAIAAMAVLGRYEPMAHAFKAKHLQDLGKLLLMFVMLWAYFSFSQFLIVWSGNLTSEIPWYMPRSHHGWVPVTTVIMLGEFFIPFLLLLSKKLKQNPRAIVIVVGILLLMRLLDLYWMVMPDFYDRGPRFNLLQIAVPVALCLLWFSAFVWQLRKRPLLPLHAINLEEALHHAS